MRQDCYRELARHLDDLPGGFPPTESGVELRILQRLFSPIEAKLAVHLTLIPEEDRVIAYRAKMDLAETSELLKEMANKGLIFRIFAKNGQTLFMAAQFVIGIWEYHVNDLDEAFIRDMEAYMPTLFDHTVWEKTPQLRTIPVGRSLTPQLKVMPYEMAEELVSGQKLAVVAPCICRRERHIVGEGCDRPEESCLVFGMGARYYRDNGLGRVIDHEEVKDILKKADKAGLILQPSNAKKIVNICCCCGCCCGILRNIKTVSNPARLVSSPFVAEFAADDCSGCGVCATRCQMDAFHFADDKVYFDAARCIGCGLCVSTCPTQALTLVRKPESVQPQVPPSVTQAYINLGRARGRLSTAGMVKMQLKSKLDRLRAAS
jgi:electron transport complex protein RnfB